MQTLEDYRVELDYYSGPLDLLLFLVKKNEIDLHDIPIAKLTDQYLHHLETIQRFDINLASDFLVMAATLLEIKSQMFVPKGEASDEAGEGETQENALSALDPRYELVKQLLAYKRFKDAANTLDDRREVWEARFPYRPAKLPKSQQGPQPGDEDYIEGEEDAEAAPVEIDLEDVSITDLCEAFARILESIGQAAKSVHAVTYDDTPISLHAEDIYDRLKREGPLTLQAIFIGRKSRSEMIGLFLATLELVRQKKIKVKQERIAGEIAIELRPDGEQLQTSDDKATDWTDPETGQMQYEWPSEHARMRAEKRASRRLARFGGKKDEEDEDDEGGYIEIKRETLDEMIEQVGSPESGVQGPESGGVDSPESGVLSPESENSNPETVPEAGVETSGSMPVAEVSEPPPDRAPA